MALESISTIRKNRVYAPIILGISILLVVFITRPFFSNYSNAQTELATAQATEQSKQEEFNKLKAMEKNFQGSGATELSERVKKIEKDFKESDILETILINDYTQTSGIGSAKIIIGNVSVDKGAKSPSGLYRGTANISLSANSTADIVDYLTYLTTATPFAFTLDTINLPIDTAESEKVGGVNLTVTLGIYYYK